MVIRKQVAWAISAAVMVGAFYAVPGFSGEIPTTRSLAKAGPSVEALQRDLQLAACANHWDRAVELVGALIASPSISAERRAELVSFRQQLQSSLMRQGTIDVSPARCEALLASYLPAASTVSPPLNWDKGFYSAFGVGEIAPLPDQEARQQAAAQEARLTQAIETEIAPLSPARLVSTHTGSGVSAGAVSTGVDVFSFVAAGGDQVSLNVSVTDVFPGRLYIDEDSQIFLFDSAGTLLAENDDLSGLQSDITEFPLPRTGRYYVAVTTYNNDPILDSSQRITDWNGNGGSAIEYTLTITGLTPAGELALPTAFQPEL